ncbi:hypothetical protein CYMTET_53282, partial [Cymbomonas tetramitiformis]
MVMSRSLPESVSGKVLVGLGWLPRLTDVWTGCKQNLCHGGRTLKGGVVYLRSSSVISLQGSTVEHNSAVEAGGFVSSEDEVTMVSTNISAFNTAFIKNDVTGNGGAFTGENLLIHLDSCFISGNMADSGGLAHIVSGELNLTSCLFQENKATGTGGVLSLESTILLAFNSTFTANMASGGGALFLHNPSNSHILACTFQDHVVNALTARGGALLVESTVSFSLEITGSMFVNNSVLTEGDSNLYYPIYAGAVGTYRNLDGCGGAISIIRTWDQDEDITSGSRPPVELTISISTFALNAAQINGGAASIVGNVASLIQGSIFQDNSLRESGVGYTHGGALFIADANATIQGSKFFNNSADKGGGVALAPTYAANSSQGHVQLQLTHFQNNIAAVTGPGLILGLPAEVVWMKDMIFDTNYALNSEVVFWEVEPVECDNCTYIAGYISCDDTVKSSPCMCYGPSGMEPVNERVSWDLGAASTMPLVHKGVWNTSVTTMASGAGMELIVALQDITGNSLCTYPSVIGLTIRNASSQECAPTFIGESLREFLGGRANFTDLQLIGQPPCAVEIDVSMTALDGVIQSIDSNVEELIEERTSTISARFTVHILDCEIGQSYSPVATRCLSCEEDFIKFDNSSSTCISCSSVEGKVKCLGQARYRVEDGYWLSPYVAKCPSLPTEDSVNCFFEHVYPCDAFDACNTSKTHDRSTSGLE